MAYNAQILLYQSLYLNITAFCTITTTYVESAVECIGASCAITSIRPSQAPHPNSNITNLAFVSLFANFANNLMASENDKTSHRSVAIENYILDPALALQAGLDSPMIATGDQDAQNLRLQQVTNTYCYGSYNPVGIMGLFESFDTFGAFNGQPSPISNDQATTVVWQLIYVCDFGWLLALCAATLVMLAAAVIGGLLSMDVQGPDLLGYCSSLFRDSPYVGVRWMDLRERGCWGKCGLS